MVDSQLALVITNHQMQTVRAGSNASQVCVVSWDLKHNQSKMAACDVRHTGLVASDSTGECLEGPALGTATIGALMTALPVSSVLNLIDLVPNTLLPCHCKT